MYQHCIRNTSASAHKLKKEGSQNENMYQHCLCRPQKILSISAHVRVVQVEYKLFCARKEAEHHRPLQINMKFKREGNRLINNRKDLQRAQDHQLP